MPVARPSVRGWLVCLVIAALLLVTPLPASFVERFFSRAYYPTVQAIVTFLSNAVPFAVTDLLLLGAIAWVIFQGFRFLHFRRKFGFFTASTVILRRLIRILSVVAIVFM